MKNKKLKSESHGTQQQTWAGGAGAGSNFQHGKDLGTHTRGSLGTRGGDSNFSRRTQRIMPIDYFDARHDAESDKDCDGEDWATGFCPEGTESDYVGEEFYEGYVVENSKYSLQEALKINEGAFSVVADMAGDIAGDAAAAATAAIPGLGLFASPFFMFKNIGDLKSDVQNSNIAIEAFLLSPIDETVEGMEEAFDDFGTDFIDLMQRILEFFPDGETPTAEAASFFTSLGINAAKLPRVWKAITKGTDTLHKVKKSLAVTGLVGSAAQPASTLWSKVKVHGLITPALKFFMELFDSDIAPEALKKEKSFILSVPKHMILLGDLIEDYYVQKYAAELADVDFVYRYRIIRKNDSIEGYDPDNSPARHPEELRSTPGYTEQDRYEKEYVEDYGEVSTAPDYDSLPGSEFLRKLFISRPGDEALFSESLDSQKLLYLIEDIDSESDEDIDSELDEDDMNEFSGAGGAGGVSLPLGMSTKGPKGNTSANSGGAAWPYSKKQQAAFKKYSKKSFGGK